jgi:hypothetical protein
MVQIPRHASTTSATRWITLKAEDIWANSNRYPIGSSSIKKSAAKFKGAGLRVLYKVTAPTSQKNSSSGKDL